MSIFAEELLTEENAAGVFKPADLEKMNRGFDNRCEKTLIEPDDANKREILARLIVNASRNKPDEAILLAMATMSMKNYCDYDNQGATFVTLFDLGSSSRGFD